jgi:hypothetical protein
MKTAVLFSLIAGAAAFAPASQKTASTTSLESWKATSPYKNEVGAQAPVRFRRSTNRHDICQLGFFDPMGLLEDAPQERFDRLRYVEVKHGRT